MQINKRVYRKDFQTQKEFEDYSEEMQAYCLANELELTCGNDGIDVYWEIIERAPIPLEVIKEGKIKELKTARDKEEQTPIEYGGYMWDFDDKAIQRINGAIIALSDGGTITWTSATNTEINGVTANDLRGVISASAVRSNEIHIRYRFLRERVERASTKAEVENIVW